MDMEEGKINVEPRYQRRYVWNRLKACRLVESVLAGLFVPAVVLHEKHNEDQGKVCLLIFSF